MLEEQQLLSQQHSHSLAQLTAAAHQCPYAILIFEAVSSFQQQEKNESERSRILAFTEVMMPVCEARL